MDGTESDVFDELPLALFESRSVGPKVHQQHKELRAQEEDRRSHHRGDKLPEASLGEENTKEVCRIRTVRRRQPET